MDLRKPYALGHFQWKTIARIVICRPRPGIVTGIMLALARVIGETAPVLILVGYAQTINFDMFAGFHGLAARHDVRPGFGRRGRELPGPPTGSGAPPLTLIFWWPSSTSPQRYLASSLHQTE